MSKPLDQTDGCLQALAFVLILAWVFILTLAHLQRGQQLDKLEKQVQQLQPSTEADK